LSDEPDIEFSLVVVGRRFDKAARFFGPVWISRAKRNVREHLDPYEPLRRIGAEKRTGVSKKRTKD
jgi:hypothetical protein